MFARFLQTLDAKQTCAACKKHSAACFTCDCKVTTFCSEACQFSVRLRHHRPCVRIKKCLCRLVREEEKLVRTCGKNYLAQHVGTVWLDVDGRAYMRAMRDVARKYERLAVADGNLAGVNCADRIYAELLRLDHSDQLGVRDLYPFTLLTFGEFRKCYGFVAWWMVKMSDEFYDWDNPGEEFREQKEGQWIHPYRCSFLNDMLRDFCGGCGHCGRTCTVDPGRVTCAHLVVLLTIKLLILKYIETKKTPGSVADRLLSANLPGYDPEDVNVPEQEGYVRSYWHHVKEKNAYVAVGLSEDRFAKALVGVPEPRFVSGYVEGSRDEAWSVLLSCKFVWDRLGLRKRLRCILLAPISGEIQKELRMVEKQMQMLGLVKEDSSSQPPGTAGHAGA